MTHAQLDVDLHITCGVLVTLPARPLPGFSLPQASTIPCHHRGCKLNPGYRESCQLLQTYIQLQLGWKPAPTDVRHRESGQGNRGQSPNLAFKRCLLVCLFVLHEVSHVPVFLCLHPTDVLTRLYFHMPIFDLCVFCACVHTYMHMHKD